METREKEIAKVTVLGGIINVILLVFKFIAGFVGHSSAMVADAIHSFSDFATDVVVLFFIRISGKPRDKDHDFGHGKFETLATTIIGGVLLLVAAGILYRGVVDIVFWAKGGELQSPGTLALWAALVSIALKEFTYRFTVKKGRELESQALVANAWHHRSDALSSVGTAVGIGGAILLGGRWAVLDPVASVAVGIVIVKVAYDLIRNGIDELMEASLPEETENEILEVVSSFPDVSDPHGLRTRRIGSSIAIEIHVRMDGEVSLREAHDRASDIEKALKAKFGEGTHTSVHMEPEKQKRNG